jgi:hypothetical protein
MLGIYNDEFEKLIKDTLGVFKPTINNIITRCPWCELKEDKDHYHLYISLNLPIFHCFRARCPKASGTITQLIRKLTNIDDPDIFINKKELEKKKLDLAKPEVIKEKQFLLPKINIDSFIQKTLYLKKRFGFNNFDIENMKGLILNIQEFIRINNIYLNDEQKNLIPYLQDNFVVFITDKHSILSFRNINNSSFSHYKMYLQKTDLLDYFSLYGYNKNSNKIILAEGIYDIYSEYLLDITGLKNSSYLYAAGLSFSYKSLIQSIIFDHQIFQPDVVILSDSDIKLKQYKKFKKEYGYLMNSLEIMYNKGGKDFNTFPILPEKFII